MIDQGVDILGIVLGIIFLVLYARASQSLVGSFFKRYHYWMMIGAALFALAFLTDFIGVVDGEIMIFDVLHHLILLAAAIIFIVTNLQLPKEAGKYLDTQSKEKKDGAA